MKRFILLLASCTALLAGCATGTDSGGEKFAGPEETYVPTGSLIARRNVDRASPVKAANKEELENSRMMGGSTLSLPNN